MFSSWVLQILWFHTDQIASPSICSLHTGHTVRTECAQGSEIYSYYFGLDLTFPVFSPLFFSSLDAFCQTLVDTLEGTPGLRNIWSTFKPLLLGKVLYTPDTPAARLIVKEVNPDWRLQHIYMHSDFPCTLKSSSVACSYQCKLHFWYKHIYIYIYIYFLFFQYPVCTGSDQLQFRMKRPPTRQCGNEKHSMPHKVTTWGRKEK